jgi:hypothetical protein
MARCQFAQQGDVIQPAKTLLDPFAFLLTLGIVGVPCHTRIDGAAAPSAVVLRHMRRDVHSAAFFDELLRVETLSLPTATRHCPESVPASPAPHRLGRFRSPCDFRRPLRRITRLIGWSEYLLSPFLYRPTDSRFYGKVDWICKHLPVIHLSIERRNRRVSRPAPQVASASYASTLITILPKAPRPRCS